MKNSVLQSSIWMASADDQLTFSLRRSNRRKAVHDFCCDFHIDRHCGMGTPKLVRT